jgi:hypothetical protein
MHSLGVLAYGVLTGVHTSEVGHDVDNIDFPAWGGILAGLQDPIYGSGAHSATDGDALGMAGGSALSTGNNRSVCGGNLTGSKFLGTCNGDPGVLDVSVLGCDLDAADNSVMLGMAIVLRTMSSPGGGSSSLCMGGLDGSSGSLCMGGPDGGRGGLGMGGGDGPGNLFLQQHEGQDDTPEIEDRWRDDEARDGVLPLHASSVNGGCFDEGGGTGRLGRGGPSGNTGGLDILVGGVLAVAGGSRTFLGWQGNKLLCTGRGESLDANNDDILTQASRGGSADQHRSRWRHAIPAGWLATSHPTSWRFWRGCRTSTRGYSQHPYCPWRRLGSATRVWCSSW